MSSQSDTAKKKCGNCRWMRRDGEEYLGTCVFPVPVPFWAYNRFSSVTAGIGQNCNVFELRPDLVKKMEEEDKRINDTFAGIGT